MSVSDGFELYPREIEDSRGEIPAVWQVAVIGVPNAKWGEEVTALVVLRPGQRADASALITMVAARKGSFQAPKIVEFIEAIPQTAVGKPDKKALRVLYAATRSEEYTSELQSLMRISYAVFCLKKKKTT